MSYLTLTILVALLNITSSGTPVVSIVVYGGNLYLNLTLPTPAIVPTVLAVNTCTSELVDYVPSSDVVLLPTASRQCPILVKYIPQIQIVNNSIMELKIDLRNFNHDLTVVYADNIIVIPQKLEGVQFLPNKTIILRKGQTYTLDYVVLLSKLTAAPSRPPAKQPTQNVTQHTKHIVVKQNTARVAAAGDLFPLWLLYAILALIACIVVCVIVLYLIRRRASSTPF